jgi:hypothetical protein
MLKEEEVSELMAKEEEDSEAPEVDDWLREVEEDERGTPSMSSDWSWADWSNVTHCEKGCKRKLG